MGAPIKSISRSADLHAPLLSKEKLTALEVRANAVGSKLREANSVLIDFNSAPRNSISARAQMGPKHSAQHLTTGATALGLVASPMVFACGALVMKDGLVATERALQVGDAEGLVDGVATAVGGAGFAAAGVAMPINYLSSGGQIPSLLGIHASAGLALRSACVIGVGVAIMYGCILGQSVYDIAYLTKFRSEFQEARARGKEAAFEFLSSQMSLTESELKGLSLEEMAKKIEAKCDAFARRVGHACAYGVAKLMQSGNPDGIDNLLDQIDKANYQIILKKALLIVISLIGLAAVIFSFVGSGGLSSIFYAIAAVAWLTVDSSHVNFAVSNLAYSPLKKEALKVEQAVQPILVPPQQRVPPEEERAPLVLQIEVQRQVEPIPQAKEVPKVEDARRVDPKEIAAALLFLTFLASFYLVVYTQARDPI